MPGESFVLSILYLPLKLVHFSKNLVACSSAGGKILAFASHCSTNFLPILDCFIPNFKLKYDDSENIKEDRVSTVVFNLRQIKRWAFFRTLGRTHINATIRKH